ncbi:MULTISPECIES: HAAS signaling domain-containing protein [unclassified Deinococcus]|uniref:HAAS signaling domain-containing protein n=1 Tax=unclassified Deinococcus TaxID=2623546 RepID=UPI001C2FBBF2|nr:MULTISPECIES: hypothetical protein [unclassified Deinococcus]MDK2012325.1 hypothetical protein [Deinococcus sp. 43]
MTGPLKSWLDVALSDLAPAARDRMTAEYHAHVQDATHSGLTEPEAVATLGDPTQVNRALRRTYAYATEKLAAQYRTPSRRLWRVLLLLYVGYTSLMILNNLEDRADLLRHLPGPLTGLTLLLALMALMKLHPTSYPWTLGARVLVLPLMTGQWITALITPGRDTLDLSFLIVLPFALVGMVWNAHCTARRVHRTLKLDGQA